MRQSSAELQLNRLIIFGQWGGSHIETEIQLLLGRCSISGDCNVFGD